MRGNSLSIEKSPVCNEFGSKYGAEILTLEEEKLTLEDFGNYGGYWSKENLKYWEISNIEEIPSVEWKY